METTSLDIWTGEYLTITNDITIDVYEQSAPLAIVATQTEAGPSHPGTAWNFPGLNRVALLFRIFETSGGTIIQQLGKNNYVVPGEFSNVKVKATVQITADTTVGFSSGVNSFTMDGTGGKQDWTGWDLDTVDRMGGEGVMKRGVDYSWNVNTGQFLLLKTGDLFNPAEWLNIQFADQVTQITSAPPATFPLFNTPIIKTADYNVSAGDFGGLILVRPQAASSYFVSLKLPAIATVPAGKILEVEVAPNNLQTCCGVSPATGEIVDWLWSPRIQVFLCNCESFGIYRFDDTSGMTTVSMWRIYKPFGNFLRTGEEISCGAEDSTFINAIEMTSISLNVFQYARLYNDFVLGMPGSRVCNYDDWATGNNRYKFSLANSSLLANAGLFHIPNKLNQFERITDGVRLPGDVQTPAILQHIHNNGVADDTTGLHPFSLSVYAKTAADMPGSATGQPDIVGSTATEQGLTGPSGGSENRPANIAVRKFLIV